MTQISTPTALKERMVELDILRGIAILGILIMNIQSFAMPGAAYLNPTAYGDLTGANWWVWNISHVFADMKFMTIFSILFGAGIVLITERAEARSGKSRGLHYRRNFWLLIIGLIHGHLIWYGDILVAYALCGMIFYFMRKKSPKSLLITGLVLIGVHSLVYLFFGWSIEFWDPAAVDNVRKGWSPNTEEISNEIAQITGSLGEQISLNSKTATMMETSVFLMLMLWRAGGLMLVGMAFFKWGILTGKRSNSFYNRGWLIGWLIGTPLIITGVYLNNQAGWSVEYSMFTGSQFNYWGSLPMAFGHICAFMLFAKSDVLPGLRRRLAAVGQMALTNYISQSIIGVLIFYGIGFGLYGQVDRTGQILIVLGIWTLQVLRSRPWLRYFNYGPLEWAWRSLSYRKFQPFKKMS